jgi:cob(I)alamin adenosyltransferase
MIEFEKVTTRGGDRGETSLYNGERRRKDDLLFETMGDIDELSSQLGVVKASCENRGLAGVISEIQRKLIALGAQVATPKNDPLFAEIAKITEEDVVAIEKVESDYLKKTEIGTAFVLPGDTLLSAQLDVARTVCRRAERRLVGCIRDRAMIQLASGQHYLNRLSDLLFVLARHVVRKPISRGYFGRHVRP